MKTNQQKNWWTAAVVFSVAALIMAFVVKADAYKRQSSNERAVRVDVLPVQLKPGETVKFEVRMNTHSVSLDTDLAADSLLIDDAGKEYTATHWEGTPPGSHHRSGILIFPVLKENPKAVTLIIKNVSNVPERIYKWALE